MWVGRSHILNDSTLLKKFEHLIVDMLASTISSESFYNCAILGMVFLYAVGKHFDSIGFSFERVNPSVSCAVINERNIVPGNAEGRF